MSDNSQSCDSLCRRDSEDELRHVSQEDLNGCESTGKG